MNWADDGEIGTREWHARKSQEKSQVIKAKNKRIAELEKEVKIVEGKIKELKEVLIEHMLKELAKEKNVPFGDAIALFRELK